MDYITWNGAVDEYDDYLVSAALLDHLKRSCGVRAGTGVLQQQHLFNVYIHVGSNEQEFQGADVIPQFTMLPATYQDRQATANCKIKIAKGTPAATATSPEISHCMQLVAWAASCNAVCH